MKEIEITQRRSSPTVTPQALAWDGQQLWISSRDLGTLYKIDMKTWQIAEEVDPPGVIWAGVFTTDGWRFTIGKGLNDDRFVYRYAANEFERLFACPDFTGSYLSFDGEHLYFSQWYKGEIHQVEPNGKIIRTLNVGAETCGHTFVDGMLYVIRGRENKDQPGKAEEWRLARLDPHKMQAAVEDLAVIPFAARSFTFDGRQFWSNDRAGNETVAFSAPI
jgi:sugar lactone lactonase YvrE